MKPNYKWETDDDSDWEQSPIPDPNPGSGSRRTVIVLLSAVMLVFAVVLFWFEQRLGAREEIVRQNVIAAHRTLEQAIAQRDLELFSSLISREDPDWYQSQRRLLMSGRVVERRQFDLAVSSTPSEDVDISLDDNWRRAEVTFSQQYVIENGESEKAITLSQTQVYQIRGSRWQSTPPPAAYWGDTQTREFGQLTVTFAQRDEAIIERFATDLAREISAICDQYPSARECSVDTRIPIAFETDPESLLALGDTTTPALNGRTYILPTPSIVGLPVDDDAYTALYHGYTERILRALQNDLALPISLPNQDIVALCFPSFEDGLSLYSYQPSTAEWRRESDARQYSHVQALPDDSAIILRAGFPGIEIAHLELKMQRAGQVTPLFKEGTTELSARLDGIPLRPNNDSLLLSAVQGSTGLTTYRLLPIESCADGSCEVDPLAGFPLWSPGGDRSLLLVGSVLHVGDANGNPVHVVGRAFSPFWMTEDIFGFVRLRGGTNDESPDMELVVRSVITGEERLLANSADILRQLNTDFSGTFRIMYISASPAHPNLLFLAGTPVTGGAGKFYVLKLQLEEEAGTVSTNTRITRVDVLLTLDDLPVGNPATLTPTGYPPFSITPDGRHLTVVRFADSVTNTWVLYVHDIVRGETRVITMNYPVYPSPFPFYDWSADGNWLLLVDKGFLRLIAPDYEYERIITHDFAACRYPAWVESSALGNGIQ